MRCINCNSEFESERNTAKYCSDKCRAEYRYKGLSDEKGVSDEKVSEEISDETLSDEKDKDTVFRDHLNDIYHIIRDKLLQFPKEERINIWNRLGGKIMDEK